MLKLIGLLAVWLLCLTIALSSGWSAMWRLVYALGLLLVVSFLWARLNLVGLRLRRSHSASQVFVGDVFSETALLDGGPGPMRWFPRLWLELHDRSTLPGHYLDGVVSLWPGRTRGGELQSIARHRGRYTLGPVWVTSGDPFGIFRVGREIGPASSIMVYPRTVALPHFGPLGGELPGSSVQGVRVQYTTPNVTGIRQYQPGDGFNRIHWPSSARTNELMVREFELEPAGDIWLVLDLYADVQAGEGLESTEEYAVTIAASLARHLLTQGRSVGLVSQSVSLPADRGPRQLDRILQVLALARATSRLPLDAFLPAESSRFTRSSTVLVITPSTDELWVPYCQSLAGRGVRSQAILVEASTFGPAPTSLLVVASLAAANIFTYLVKHGEPLGDALAVSRTRARGYGSGG